MCDPCCCRFNNRGATGATGVRGSPGPAFNVSFYADNLVPQTLGSGNNVIQYASEVFDLSGNYDGISTFTAPATGTYQFDAGVNLVFLNSSELTETFTGSVFFRRSGMGLFGQAEYMLNVDGSFQDIVNVHIGAVINLTQFQTVTVLVANTTNNTSVDAGGSFSGFRVT
jgi:hypothetical protein